MIGVLADKKVRISRIMSRDGITGEIAAERISAQKPDSFYEKNCNIIVLNNGENIDISALLKRIEE